MSPQTTCESHLLLPPQVHNFPAGLRGACLHTNQTPPQRERVMCDVVEGRVNVLLLSPEALVGGAFWSKGGMYSLSRLPPVAFACIDEAHCVSEWSHNFRPSYLRLYKVLSWFHVSLLIYTSWIRYCSVSPLSWLGKNVFTWGLF